jgi:hypothetical protein
VHVCAGRVSSAFASDPVINVEYDHQSVNGSLSYTIDVKPGQQFQVTIKHTCPQDFDYTLHGVEKAKVSRAALGGPVPQLQTDIKGPTTFESQYGSYLLIIARKHQENTCLQWVDQTGTPATPPPAAVTDPATSLADGSKWTAVELNAATVIVAINAIDWEVGQDAAINFAPSTERHFITIPVPGDPAKKQVIRDTDREAPGRWNTATLTHIYWPGLNHGIAVGFGASNSKFEYYFGYGGGIGPRSKRFLNVAAGAVYTPLTQLPDGVHEKDIVTDASVLNNLPTQYTFRLFFALTATLFQSNNPNGKPAAQP